MILARDRSTEFLGLTLDKFGKSKNTKNVVSEIFCFVFLCLKRFNCNRLFFYFSYLPSDFIINFKILK